MTITLVSISPAIRQVLAYACRQNGLVISGIYDGYESLTRANANEVFLIHVAQNAPDLRQKISYLYDMHPDCRVVLLVPDDFDPNLAAQLSRMDVKIVNENLPTEQLISTLQDTQFEKPPQITTQSPITEQVAHLHDVSVKLGDADLTNREIVILSSLAAGGSNKEIANALGISDGTVKVHLRSAFRKIKVNNRTQAALWARENLKIHVTPQPEQNAWTGPEDAYWQGLSTSRS